MKRHGNLWDAIVSFDNLLKAARFAQRAKRFRPNVLAFNHNLEQELLTLKEELCQQSYAPGAYRTFRIKDPKPRLISAAPYRDRVVHHALCNVIGPLLERSFIRDSYANRLGYGTHRALERFTQFARSRCYVFQADICKYFPSIDHEILKQIIRRKLKCQPTLGLIDTIIDHSNPQDPMPVYFPGDALLTPIERRRGLPIGNLTSQFFANLYLNGFDHFVHHQLKCGQYLRYVDDFALFSDDQGYLVEARGAIEEYLNSLRLLIHPIKSQIFETRIGATFVGFRVLPDRLRVRSENLRRGRRRVRRSQKLVIQRKLSPSQFRQSLQSWMAHLAHGDTYRLRRKIFAALRKSAKPRLVRLSDPPTQTAKEGQA